MHLENANSHRPITGVGIGLRSQHFSYIISHKPAIAWFEVLIDNYLNEQGSALANLRRISDIYPIVFHSVGLSLGSIDSLNQEYLKKLKQFMDEFKPAYLSDHLCWTSLNNQYTHQLLPLPYTIEAVQHVVQRIKAIQDYLGQQILIENVSSYLNYKASEMPEWEFLATVSAEADCNILLDINNIFVSAKNQNFKPETYLAALDPKRIKQFHLAGYEDHGHYLLDSHNATISASVWQLYQQALVYFGPVPTLIEWDSNIPEFAALQLEVDKAKHFIAQIGAITSL